MNPYTSYLEQAFGRGDVTGPKMQAAIREWFDLYLAGLSLARTRPTGCRC